jgi:hypothetical protein
MDVAIILLEFLILPEKDLKFPLGIVLINTGYNILLKNILKKIRNDI